MKQIVYVACFQNCVAVKIEDGSTYFSFCFFPNLLIFLLIPTPNGQWAFSFRPLLPVINLSSHFFFLPNHVPFTLAWLVYFLCLPFLLLSLGSPSAGDGQSSIICQSSSFSFKIFNISFPCCDNGPSTVFSRAD